MYYIAFALTVMITVSICMVCSVSKVREMRNEDKLVIQVAHDGLTTTQSSKAAATRYKVDEETTNCDHFS